MKQLKFMIAAAAAIGLAGAAQADFPSDTDKDALGNTGFEEFAVDTDVTTGTKVGDYSYFVYTGDTEADNESKIIGGSSGLTKSGRAKGEKFDANQKVLQVNTGTEPLLRTINPEATNDDGTTLAAVDIPGTGIYIDTLVQFTVTPAGDTVTPTADDKLMIYLQEVLDNTETTDVNEAATNLVVKCCEYTEGRSAPPPVLPASWTTNDYVAVLAPESGVASTSVKAGEWYRLTVLAKKVGTATVFEINIDGVPLNPTLDGVNKLALTSYSADTKYFPSLKPDDTTLKAVGFAGEGLVDDIVFSTTLDEILDSIDFTLLVSGATAVKAVIGENNEVEWAQDKFVLPAGTTTFRIEYTPATVEALWNPNYTAALSGAVNCSFEGLTVTLGSGEPSATLTVTATEGGSAPTVGENDPASSVGITTPAFSSDKGAALQKVVDWAVKAGLTKTQLNEMAPFEDETGNATNELQEAFLLNCAVSELAAAKAAFKVGALTFDQDGNPVLPAAATSWVDSNDNEIEFNAVPAVLGASELGGTWGTATTAHKFFKAVLTK